MSANNSTPPQAESMTIITEKTDFFAWLPNCIVYEWGLSAEAIAAALYLNGKPSNWQTRPADLRSHFNWGDSIWRRVSKELRACGLLILKNTAGGKELRFKLPDMKLKIKQKPTVENQRMDKKAIRGKPTCGKPTCGKPTDISDKEDLTDKEEESEKENARPSKNLTSNDMEVTQRFSRIEAEKIFYAMWERYPEQKARSKAMLALIALLAGKPRGEAENLARAILMGFNAYLDEQAARQQLKEQGADISAPFYKHLDTWLNGRCWEDNYTSPAELLASAKSKGRGNNRLRIESLMNNNRGNDVQKNS